MLNKGKNNTRFTICWIPVENRGKSAKINVSVIIQL